MTSGTKQSSVEVRAIMHVSPSNHLQCRAQSLQVAIDFISMPGSGQSSIQCTDTHTRIKLSIEVIDCS